MKKVILLVLCLIFVLSGCGKLEKAEPFYTETKEEVVFSTQYEYYFDDEHSIRCSWENKTSEGFSFYDTFELHVLGDDGEWYVVSNGEEVEFNTAYCYGISADGISNARYDLSVYTEKLKEGESYRISTFFFDDNGNNYQAFAEFVCDNKLAEEEMKLASNGYSDHRTDPEVSDDFLILENNE